MKKPIMGSVLLSLFLAASLAAAPNNASNKVYRWVDEDGNVHYTETLPPNFRDRKADVLDEQGLMREKDVSLVPPAPIPQEAVTAGELPRDSSGLQRPQPQYDERELKDRQDALLLLRYDSEQEILDAMEVEIKQLDYDQRLLSTSRASLEEAYLANIREAAERQRAGVAVEPKLVRDIDGFSRRLAENEQSIEGLHKREAFIRGEFEVSLGRYRALTAEHAGEAK